MLAPPVRSDFCLIAYLYLYLLTYVISLAGKINGSKALRGKDIMYLSPVRKSKIHLRYSGMLRTALPPMAAPLIMSFFLGMAIKESRNCTLPGFG